VIPGSRGTINKPISILLVSLLIVSSLSIVLLVGCNGEGPTPPEPAPAEPLPAPADLGHDELLQIVSDALRAPASADSYKVDSQLAFIVGTAGESGQNKTQSGFITQLIADNAGEKTQISSNMSMSIGMSGGALSVITEIYLQAGYAYLKMDLFGNEQDWMKIAATPEMLEAFNVGFLESDLNILESPAGIELISMETYDGSECYVLRLTPNDEKLLEFAQKQQLDNVEVDWDDIADISDLFKHIDYIVRISTDTRLLKKMDVNATIDFTGYIEQAPETADVQITLDINGVTRIYDYNVPVSIVLPDEAGNAPEISPDELLGG
jgi:hypothetical protein